MLAAAPSRFQALDIFRGLTVCFMIIVNTSGNWGTTFAPLLHAKWHGFTPTDLVFPSFLFAVGNAMAFVMPKWQSWPQRQVLLKIFKRTAIIFLLGYLMYWFPFFRLNDEGSITSFPISETRIMGVLQRIALCYGIAALLVYYFITRTAVIIGAALMLLYWALLLLFGTGTNPLSLEDNAARLLDIWLMGEKHLYHGEGIAFDPEGWLSTLPAVANVLAGYAAGAFIKRMGNTYEMLARLMLAGVACLALAYVWQLMLPLNKKLWTGSFVMLTVGLDCLIIAAIVYITHFKERTRWGNFFEVFGKNPLFIYLLSELLVPIMWMVSVEPGMSLYSWIYQTIFSHAGAYLGAFLFALAYMLLCWIVGYLLHKRRIYVRV